MKFFTIEELKKLDTNQASCYCNELRKYVIDTVNMSAGHLASNLGITEISVALMRVFNSPDDKIIYDVGHQCYIHKLLTGRIFTHEDLRKLNGYSGFTKRDESVHDPFGAGHSSTALSAALGFSRADRLKGNNDYSVAVIGDGAFCTGMTFEALNNVMPDDKVIIILNDNEMSISKNVGAMSSYLNKMRSGKRYLTFKKKTKKIISKTPLLFKLAIKIKNALKRLLLKGNFFDDLGVYYLGPADGNDLSTVEMLLREAKDRNSPVLIHLITKKGKGYTEAEADPGRYHFVSAVKSEGETFSNKFSSLLTEFSEIDEKAVAITAAMCDGTGLSNYKKTFPNRLFDVGISEEHAATFGAALSAGGMIPFYAVYSTFFQRSYDQIVHDVALQKLKMIVALDRAGIVGADGATHHGLYDVSMMLNVPDSVIYSPATFKELEYSFKKCVEYPYLSILRYPKGTEDTLTSRVFQNPSDFTLDTVAHSDVLFVTYGRITGEVLKAKALLMKDGYSVSILKFLKIKPIDLKKTEMLINSISPNLLCVVEEGMKVGGFGEYLLSEINLDARKEIIAVDDCFVPHGTVEELFELCSLSASEIYKRVKKCL